MDFEIYNGDSKIIPIDVVDAAGDPVDLFGAEIRWRFAAWAGAFAMLTKTLGNGIELDPENDHRVFVTINAGEIQGLYPGAYYHSLTVSFDGVQDTVLDGMVDVRASPRSE